MHRDKLKEFADENSWQEYAISEASLYMIISFNCKGIAFEAQRNKDDIEHVYGIRSIDPQILLEFMTR